MHLQCSVPAGRCFQAEPSVLSEGSVFWICVVGYHWDYIFDWTILKHAHTQGVRPAPRAPGDGQGVPQDEQQQKEQQQQLVEGEQGNSLMRPTATTESSRRR